MAKAKEEQQVKQKKVREKVELLTDPTITPTSQDQIGKLYMVNYCKAKGIEDLQWLLTISESKQINRSGKETKAGTYTIRKAFVEKYFPDLRSKAAKKEPTIEDMVRLALAELEGK